MPANVGFEYQKSEKEYLEAKTNAEKMAALRKMLSTAPSHKGAERLRQDIKERISAMREKQEKEKKQGKGKKGHDISIKKEGAAQIAIVGFPNSGKSTLLSQLSGTEVEIAEYEFTTKMPVVRMIPFENIQLQGIEIPAVYPGFYESKLGRPLIALIRNADLVLVLIRSDEKSELDAIKTEFEKAGLILSNKFDRRGYEQELPHVIVKKGAWNLEIIKKQIWQRLDKIRVQTRTKAGVAEKPIILRTGATVKSLAGIVHKDFLRKFKHAKVWGPSAAFDGQQVGLDHVLKDNDIVEIFLK